MTRNLVLAFLAVAGVYGQAPVVSPGGVVNHFSYALPGMPNAGIAQGSIFDIYGTNIGPGTLVQAAGFPLPAQLGGTAVQVTVGGTTVDVLLFFVSSGQIAGLLPSRTPVGPGTLTVTVNGTRSAAAPITVSSRSIGILSLSQNGQGPAVMQVGNAAGQVLLNSVTNSAQAGQVGVFYGTGLGAVPFDESRGAPVLNLDPPVLAFVDGRPAKILFQGRVPGLAGLDQFNVAIPAGVTGCYATVWFQTGNVLSILSTFSVSPGPSCPDPLPATVGGGSGTLKAAGLVLVRSQQKIGTVDYTGDVASAAFSVTDLSKVPASTPSPLTVIGGCVVGPLVNTSGGSGASAVSYLDAGPVMTITGPNGVKQLAKFPTGYSSQLGSTALPGQVPVPSPPYLAPGVYKVDNGSGSAEVPAFSVSITLPDLAFAWSNADVVATVSRAAGLDITWAGGDRTGYVDIAGVSLLARSPTQPVAAGGYFSCRAAANAGQFRIPAQVLLFLPASTVTGGVPSGSLTVSNTTSTVSFPLAGFQFADLTHVASVTRGVAFQ